MANILHGMFDLVVVKFVIDIVVVIFVFKLYHLNTFNKSLLREKVMKNNIPTIFKDERVPLVVADNKKIQLRITTVALTFSSQF